jgi:F-type H+-transporting ATPase subunit delta
VNNRKAIVAYARALSSLPEELALKASRFIEVIGSAVGGSDDLVNFLDHPAIGFDDKITLLQTLADEVVSAQLREVLRLMFRERKAGLLPSVQREMERLYNRAHGIRDVEVTTASALSDEWQALIRQRLAAVLGEKMKSRFEVNPELIAGMRVRIDNTVFDDSAQGVLNSIQKTLGTDSGR